MDRRLADLSVVIATRNRQDALARCLEALLTGEVLPAEIVIADQSQDDRTRLLFDSHRSSPVSLVYIRHPGGGQAASQNAAIALAHSAIVAVTDDDCVPAANWIDQVERGFSSPEDIDVLTGRVLPLGPLTPDTYPIASRAISLRMEFDRRAMPWVIGSGNNFAVKRHWFERVGGNDERLGPGSPGLGGGGDIDLFYRLLRAGARIRYEPASVVYHATTDRAGRIARRIPYGFGVGACCSLWLGQGDANALRVLFFWLLMRIRRFSSGSWRRNWILSYEEVLVLFGTLKGLVYGFRQPAASRRTGWQLSKDR